MQLTTLLFFIGVLPPGEKNLQGTKQMEISLVEKVNNLCLGNKFLCN